MSETHIQISDCQSMNHVLSFCTACLNKRLHSATSLWLLGLHICYQWTYYSYYEKHFNILHTTLSYRIGKLQKQLDHLSSDCRQANKSIHTTKISFLEVLFFWNNVTAWQNLFLDTPEIH